MWIVTQQIAICLVTGWMWACPLTSPRNVLHLSLHCTGQRAGDAEKAQTGGGPQASFVSVVFLRLRKCSRTHGPCSCSCWAFYEWGSEGEERASYSSHWVMHFIHSQPSSSGLYSTGLPIWEGGQIRHPPPLCTCG